ncbi:MAG: hypothetical protein RL115_1945, partial [Bacteroidota bacterium]
MKKIAVFALLPVVYLSCNKKDAPPNPCTGVNYDVQYIKTPAVGTANNGSIIISFPVGDTIRYQLNNNSFQNAPTF